MKYRRWPETRDFVLGLLAEEPFLTNREVGEALGRSKAWGKVIMRRLIAEGWLTVEYEDAVRKVTVL